MATVPASGYRARALPLLLAMMGCLALASAVVDAGDSANTHRKLLQAHGSPAQVREYRRVRGMPCAVNVTYRMRPALRVCLLAYSYPTRAFTLGAAAGYVALLPVRSSIVHG